MRTRDARERACPLGRTWLNREALGFQTKSGRLVVSRLPGAVRIRVDFPEAPVGDHVDGAAALAALGIDGEASIRSARRLWSANPRLWSRMRTELRRARTSRCRLRDRHCPRGRRADSEGFDVVTRVFAPGVGIPRIRRPDRRTARLRPTGAAYSGVSTITSFQASARGGYFECSVAGRRSRTDPGPAARSRRGELSLTKRRLELTADAFARKARSRARGSCRTANARCDDGAP